MLTIFSWDEGGTKVRSRFSKYVRQVRRNPHLFCYNDCCMDSCPKHKNRCPYDGQYLFAMLKDTPFCPHEDIETYVDPHSLCDEEGRHQSVCQRR